MKFKNRNVNLLLENVKILQNELAQKNEIIKSLIDFQSTVFESLSATKNDAIILDLHHEQQPTAGTKLANVA